MQVRKTYRGIKPELLFDEVRDLVLKQGTTVGETKVETYPLPGDSSSFVSRGTLTFKIQGGSGKGEEECLRAHILGSDKGETKLILDINDKLFPKEKVATLQEEMDFIFGSYAVE